MEGKTLFLRIAYLIFKVKSIPISLTVEFTLKIPKVEITLKKIYTISVSQLLLTGGQTYE